MKRVFCIVCVALGLAGAACGSSSAQPTPRPPGQRGTLLNPIDKSRSTVDRLNNQTNQQEQQTGAGYP